MAVTIGVDVGGTFTDFVLYDPVAGFLILKHLTTPDDPSRAVFEGLDAILLKANTALEQVARIVHATTLVSNTLIERRGAPCGLIATVGFRDIIEIGRGNRYDNYDLQITFAEPLVPRRRRLEVRERIDASGRVVHPLDEDGLRRAVDFFVADGVESLAICFLHAYLNPEHERRAVRLVRKWYPQLLVTLGADVVAEIGEYERTVTAVANAYVQPIVQRYLKRLSLGLQRRGFGGRLYFMRSDRGLTTLSEAVNFPIRLLESGTAAGASAAGWVASHLKHDLAVAFDMGGTTAKAALIEQGRPAEVYGSEVARVHRFKSGSGIPIRAAAVEQIEIGAGGGSIAARNSLGLLSVGPESAGADPGPACYGRGGAQATVTDANVLLGFLDASYLLGGEISLDPRKADQAVRSLAMILELDPTVVPTGIRNLTDENMALAFNTFAAEKGIDPRDYVLIAFGGGGPLHADALARRMGVGTVVIPPAASVFSAVGLIISPVTFIHAQTYQVPLIDLDHGIASAVLLALEDYGRKQMAEIGILDDSMVVERVAEVRYVGQRHQVTVALPDPLPGTGQMAVAIRARFEEAYRQQYGHPGLDQPAEAVTWRVRVSANPDVPASVWLRLAGADASRKGQPSLKGRRLLKMNSEASAILVGVYARQDLGVGDTVQGPALIEERDSVTFVGPRSVATVHQSGAMLLRLRGVGEYD